MGGRCKPYHWAWAKPKKISILDNFGAISEQSRDYRNVFKDDQIFTHLHRNGIWMIAKCKQLSRITIYLNSYWMYVHCMYILYKTKYVPLVVSHYFVMYSVVWIVDNRNKTCRHLYCVLYFT
jgi:hypothetical protein